jgi:lipopolysaccharide transport system permease protein
MNPHQVPSTSITELFASFWRNRQLILRLTQREVIGRYRGSVLGLAWSFFNPLLMLTVYTFVFSVVFRARWGEDVAENKNTFAIQLFIGLIVHGIFAECANRAPALILNNANYVKKVVFPLEILPWVVLGSALFHAGISVLMLMLAQLVINHTLALTALFFPIVILPLMLITLGVAWSLSAVGVYLRDVRQAIGVLTTVLLFLSPVFYPRKALPAEYQILVAINPLTFALEEGRKSLMFGQAPDGLEWGLYMLVGIAAAWMGFWLFQKSRKGFADVL